MFKLKIKGLNAEVFKKKVQTNFADPNLVADIQTEVIDKIILPSISGGSSPVRGQRRFKAYKDKDKYPANKKASRPVNLKLSGEMLSKYIAEKINSNKISIGISRTASEEVKTYAEANNVGTEHITARRFVPVKGETFTVTITRKLKELFAKRLAKILNK